MSFKFRYFLILFVFAVFFISDNVLADSGGVTLTVTISEVCGNGSCSSGETCSSCPTDCGACSSCGNGSCSGGETCSSCPTDCGACPSGGGGGGGGAILPPSTAVVFSGRAYPKSSVTLLKDAQVAVSTIADPNSNFQITLSNLSAGNYIFSIYGEDKDGIRSSLFTFSVSVTANVTTNVGGIFIAPTIAVDKSEVRQGDNIAVFGQSASQSEITIMISSEESYFAKVGADKDGVYLYNFDTSPLDFGSHNARSKAALAGSISSFSSAVAFKVGTKNVLAQKPVKKVLKGDINSDGRVNLIDFSITAYWYKRTLSATFKSVELTKLNGDGKVNLVDFSIMAYYWTG